MIITYHIYLTIHGIEKSVSTFTVSAKDKNKCWKIAEKKLEDFKENLRIDEE